MPKNNWENSICISSSTSNSWNSSPTNHNKRDWKDIKGWSLKISDSLRKRVWDYRSG